MSDVLSQTTNPLTLRRFSLYYLHSTLWLLSGAAAEERLTAEISVFVFYNSSSFVESPTRSSLNSPVPCLQAQLIAQSIGQAFSVAYQEFLRANGINPEDLSQKEYSDIINTQEMYNDDLIHFSNSENCKEVGPAWLRIRVPTSSPAAGTFIETHKNTVNVG